MSHQFENLPQRKLNTKSTVYTEQFEKWLEEQKSNGLTFVNLYYLYSYDKESVNYELFCEEFMRIQNSPTLPDPEVLGSRSL